LLGNAMNIQYYFKIKTLQIGSSLHSEYNIPHEYKLVFIFSPKYQRDEMLTAKTITHLITGLSYNEAEQQAQPTWW
jgi:hypothetical protein